MAEARSHSSVVSCSPEVRPTWPINWCLVAISTVSQTVFTAWQQSGLDVECLSDLVEGHNHERDEQRAAQGHLGFGASTGYARAHNS